MVVVLEMDVTPLLDCAVMITLKVPEGVAGVGVGPWCS